MRYGEIHLISLSCIDVAHHRKEATSLEHEVGIYVHEWIVAQFRSYRSVLLNSELSKTRHILRSVVLGEIRYVSSEMAFKHLGNLEVEIKIAPYIELWQWEGAFLLAELICNAVLPIENAEFEVLRQFCR